MIKKSTYGLQEYLFISWFAEKHLSRVFIWQKLSPRFVKKSQVSKGSNGIRSIMD
jgi:hypothetical protein